MMLGHLLCHQFGFIPLLTSPLRFPPSEIQALLLSDCLVLLQRGPDDRLQLRYPSRWLGGGGGGGGDSKTSFSPLVKLDSLLVRSVATGSTAVTFLNEADLKKKKNAALFVVLILWFHSRQQSPLHHQHHREADLRAGGRDVIWEKHVSSFLQLGQYWPLSVRNKSCRFWNFLALNVILKKCFISSTF